MDVLKLGWERVKTPLQKYKNKLTSSLGHYLELAKPSNPPSPSSLIEYVARMPPP
jgi:hypothetical protein